jgi:Zn-dependent metalloprotease
MRNITHPICFVIPSPMLSRLATQTSHREARRNARATLAQMHELANGRAEAASLEGAPAIAAPVRRRKSRHVYDAQNQHQLPGTLVLADPTSEHEPDADIEALEAWDGSGATSDFFARVFGRNSIDGKGMRLVSTVHYGTSFENALWNGRQMVYGDGDGRIFNRFTASLDVIAHELSHGYIQKAAGLGYHGQTGALNEHLADAIGIMVKQYTLGQTAQESDWLIGSGIFGPDVNGIAVRSMAHPGTAYDDHLLGRDPQPWHMRDYVETTEDNGGVHINSGILNHAFANAAKALGGYTWDVLGRIWYVVLTEHLGPDADFADFTRATVAIAGELYGKRGRVQRIVAKAWSDVGLPVARCRREHRLGRRTSIHKNTSTLNKKRRTTP